MCPDEPHSLVRYRYDGTRPSRRPAGGWAAADVAAVEEDAKYFGSESPADQDELSDIRLDGRISAGRLTVLDPRHRRKLVPTRHATGSRLAAAGREEMRLAGPSRKLVQLG